MPAYDQIPSLAQQGLVAGWQTGEREQALIDQERARQFEQDVRLQSLDLARQQTRRAQEELAAKRQFEQDVRLQSLDLARQQTRRAQEELVRKVQAEKDQQSTDALFYKTVTEGGDPRTIPNFGELLAKASPDAQRFAMGDVHTRKERDETVMDIEKLRAMAPGMVRMVLSDPKNKPFYDKVQKHRIDLKDEERPLSDLEQEKMTEAQYFNSAFDLGVERGLFNEADRERWSPSRTDIKVFDSEYRRRDAELQAKTKAYTDQQAAKSRRDEYVQKNLAAGFSQTEIDRALAGQSPTGDFPMLQKQAPVADPNVVDPALDRYRNGQASSSDLRILKDAGYITAGAIDPAKGESASAVRAALNQRISAAKTAWEMAQKDLEPFAAAVGADPLTGEPKNPDVTGTGGVWNAITFGLGRIQDQEDKKLIATYQQKKKAADDARRNYEAINQQALGADAIGPGSSADPIQDAIDAKAAELKSAGVPAQDAIKMLEEFEASLTQGSGVQPRQ